MKGFKSLLNRIVEVGDLHRSWKILGLSLGLELLMRYLRLPFFPIWLPLFFWQANKIKAGAIFVLAYGIVGGALTVFFLGSGSLDFVLAFFTSGLMVGRGIFKKQGILLVPGLVLFWVLWSLVLGSLPTGSFSFEVLFTAAFSRFAGSEYIAGVISRFLLILLTYLFFLGLKSLGQKVPLQKLIYSSLLTGLVVSPLITCGENQKPLFEPAAPGTETTESFAGQKIGETHQAPPHVILPEAARTNKNCMACHKKKIGPTTLPRKEKGIHEIHFTLAKIKKRCVFCHERAGLRGFPHLSGGGDRRREYNQKCIQCHNRTSGDRKYLNWSKKYR